MYIPVCLFARKMIYYFQSHEKGFRFHIENRPGGIRNHILVLTVHTLVYFENL